MAGNERVFRNLFNIFSKFNANNNRTQMTLIVKINADFLWILRFYHNYQRHLRSIFGCVIVYFIYCELPRRQHGH
jgi:hypothetical protein